MTAMTDFFENKVGDHMLRNQAYSPPATIYLATYTTATTDAGGGGTSHGGSYGRQACALAAFSGGASSNTALITYSNMPASTLTHAALHDAIAAGNMLMHGALAASKVVGLGDTLLIAIGDVDVAFL